MIVYAHFPWSPARFCTGEPVLVSALRAMIAEVSEFDHREDALAARRPPPDSSR